MKKTHRTLYLFGKIRVLKTKILCPAMSLQVFGSTFVAIRLQLCSSKINRVGFDEKNFKKGQ